MRLYSRALATAYLVSVIALLVLEFYQFQKVDRLRGQIAQSYEMISGRDEGIRLELEYRRFRSIVAKYALGVNLGAHNAGSDEKPDGSSGTTQDVSHQMVHNWFDILWSRAFSINTISVDIPPEQHEHFNQMMSGLRISLRAVDQLVQSLEPGDFIKYQRIDRQLALYEDDISSMAAVIAQTRVKRASQLQHRLDDALKSMNVMLLSSAVGVMLILTLFGTEAYRARKEEMRIKGREARVRFLAEHDPLTGLGNRSFLNQKMNQFIRIAEETGKGFNLVLFDLDKFKDVNDTFGHPMGDRLLKNAAARLINIFSQENDIVVRLGGDEFAILQCADFAETERSVIKAINALSSAFDLSGNDIRISSSAGISRYPDLSSSSDELLRDADLALYEAKSRGRQTYSLYEAGMSVAIQNRVRLEADLRHSLLHGGKGLEVYYQPQVTRNLENGRCCITGVEALVRWFHPELGQIPTMEFIEIAENSGLIGTLSDWIFREACSDLVSWHKAGHKLHLSINLSPHQLNNSNLDAELMELLDNTGFDPNYLTVEITESVDVQDTRKAASMLSRLSAKGISLAMDDFGTGYSNLGYLKSLPLNVLKIDRSFVQQIEEKEEDRKLVRGVINLARGMGLKVVAEGVETEKQMLFLQAQRCDIFQGYLFGKPMHKLAILAMLSGVNLASGTRAPEAEDPQTPQGLGETTAGPTRPELTLIKGRLR
ncbi:putative bifunctional diguanylate cyclase/phosphodiesterase [Cohaesibacter haloalkalitolerans]|uniref:putative bifunctional diguanylate cyclase/phosphodiesterase n=1 Tax=Cohaesibacter haloalkalitolerans TaxID=1162980 RepID=UPI000E65B11C|nr:bifunctional diguanylate cyclase/phosphodiesterase [Cohaesibacter haloalkalitolerans]